MGKYISFSSSILSYEDRLEALRRAQLPQNNGSGGQQTLNDLLFTNLNSTYQDRLKTFRRAQLPQADSSGGSQILTDKTLALMGFPYRPKEQEQERAPDAAHSIMPLRIRQPQDPQIKRPDDVQKSHESSMTNDASRRKVAGSRVAKSSTTTKSKVHSVPAMGGSSGETVIRVFINNRLGSKAEIVCSPSDTVGDFKKLAALKLGTGAEAIRLKRQGQRALRDALTLEDYEIGGGSSLD